MSTGELLRQSDETLGGKNDGTAFRGRSDILSRFILHAPNRLGVKLVIACAPMWTTQFNFWFKKLIYVFIK